MSILNRRAFLKLSLGAGVGLTTLPALASLAAPVRERVLTLYNTHTGERAQATYWADGEYVESEIALMNRLLRDHRSGQVFAIEHRLFDTLHNLQVLTGARTDFHVISGYRSAATNALLRRQGRGVAKESLHTHGKAIDIRLPGHKLSDLQRAALALRAGGVGYYPQSDFIHLDTGRVRAW
jgi:uncharacterized protein YcbK (DUF882 family)